MTESFGKFYIYEINYDGKDKYYGKTEEILKHVKANTWPI